MNDIPVTLFGVLAINLFLMFGVYLNKEVSPLDFCDIVLCMTDGIKKTRGKIFHAFVVVPPVILWLLPSMLVQLVCGKILKTIEDLYEVVEEDENERS